MFDKKYDNLVCDLLSLMQEALVRLLAKSTLPPIQSRSIPPNSDTTSSSSSPKWPNYKNSSVNASYDTPNKFQRYRPTLTANPTKQKSSSKLNQKNSMRILIPLICLWEGLQLGTSQPIRTTWNLSNSTLSWRSKSKRHSNTTKSTRKEARQPMALGRARPMKVRI